MTKMFFMCLIVLVTLSGQAKAVQFEGFEFPQEIQVENERLALNGLALRKVTFLGIRVLIAGLYLPRPISEPLAIEKMAGRKQLRLHFLNILIGYLLFKLDIGDQQKKIVSWLGVIGILMPVGILMELILNASPVFVLVGAVSMTASVFLLGVFVAKSKKVIS
jgi:hypothetical protein